MVFPCKSRYSKMYPHDLIALCVMLIVRLCSWFKRTSTTRFLYCSSQSLSGASFSDTVKADPLPSLNVTFTVLSSSKINYYPSD